jgi:hypothetical protein
MKSLAADIRKLMLDRIQAAPFADLFSIASSLCANDEAPATVRELEPAYVPGESHRFTALDLHGRPSNGTDWVAVYDAETNLTWTRKPLECGAVNWKDALAAAANYRLFGAADWRAPTVKERVSIIDYGRVGPALYPEFDACDASWEWTSTPDAESPSDYAWDVDLRYGGVSRLNQSCRSGVRAVRAGQPLGLGI